MLTKWIYQAETKRYKKQNRTYLLGHPLTRVSTVVYKIMAGLYIDHFANSGLMSKVHVSVTDRLDSRVLP